MRLLSLILVLVTVSASQAGVYLTITRSSSPGPSAREQAASDARRQIEMAQAEFRREFAKVLADHPMSFELRQARIALAKAHSRLNDARSAVVAQLRSDPAYRRLDLLIVEREHKLRRETDTQKRIEMAEELLRLRGQRTELESRAQSENGDVSFARAAVQSAMNELQGVEKMHRWHMMQSDQLSAARSRLDTAREQLASIGD